MEHIEIILETATKVHDGKMNEPEAVQFLINNIDKEVIYRCYMGSDNEFKKISTPEDSFDELPMIVWELIETTADQLEL